MEITVCDWGKYNPKRSQKTYTWLRLNNDFFYSPDMDGLTGEEMIVWVVILCLASKENTGKIKMSPDKLARRARVDLSVINSAIQKLFDEELITTTPPPASPLSEPALHRTTLHYTGLHSTTPKKVRKKERKKESKQARGGPATPPHDLPKKANHCSVPDSRREPKDKPSAQTGEPLEDSDTPQQPRNPQMFPPDKPNLVNQVIDYLNSVTGKKYKPKSSATQKFILARAKEGFGFEDFKRVIDVKWIDHKRGTFDDKYLRPATLFNASKFEGYLNQGPAKTGEEQWEGQIKEWAKG